MEFGIAAIAPLGRSLRGVLEAAADPSSGGSRRLVPGLVVLAPLGFQAGVALAFDAADGVPRRTLHIVVTNEATLRAGAGAQPSELRSR